MLGLVNKAAILHFPAPCRWGRALNFTQPGVTDPYLVHEVTFCFTPALSPHPQPRFALRCRLSPFALNGTQVNWRRPDWNEERGREERGEEKE